MLKSNKRLTYLLFLFTTQSLWAKVLSFNLDPSIHNTASLPYISHYDPNGMNSYATMEVPFKPVADVRIQLEAQLQQSLKNRGEAHITVITPVEYTKALRHYINMKEIDQLAIQSHLQASTFKVLCLGRGTAKIGTSMEYTYYIVIDSTHLQNFRILVNQLFLDRGGDPSAFNPYKYYPHITLGFTKMDLHESHGVIKNTSTCIGSINDN